MTLPSSAAGPVHTAHLGTKVQQHAVRGPHECGEELRLYRENGQESEDYQEHASSG